MKRPYLRWAARALACVIAFPVHAQTFTTQRFNNYLQSLPTSVSALGASDKVPILQGGATKGWAPANYFLNRDGSNLSISADLFRSNIGLGTAATHQFTDFLQSSNNLSDVSVAATARTNIGLGDANVPAFAGLSLAPPTGETQAVNTLQNGTGTLLSPANFNYNQIFIQTDNIFTDPGQSRDSLNNGLLIDLRKNSTGLATGGFQGAHIRGTLLTATPSTNRNRNYVGAKLEAYAQSGDGGVSTTLAADANPTDTTITVVNSAGLDDGNSLKVVLDDGRVLLTHVVGTPVGALVTIDNPVPAIATAGNVVYNPKGAFFGANPQGRAAAASTNTLEITGGEVNIALPLGASTFYKGGWTIVQESTDKVQGQVHDCALCLSNQTGAVGWRHGIKFGYMNGVFPTTISGSLIGIDRASSTPTFVNALDFLNSNITGNVLSFANGSWGGNGLLTLADNAQFSSSGYISVGTYTTASTPTINHAPTVNFSTTDTYIDTVRSPILQPTGASASVVRGTLFAPAAGASAVNIATMTGNEFQLPVNAGYTGVITAGHTVTIRAPVNAGTNPVTNTSALNVIGSTANGDGVTSDYFVNTTVGITGAIAAAGAGGLGTNRSLIVTLPTGSSATTTNYGVRIAGNGGAASTNYGLYADSTARSLFGGKLTVGATTDPGSDTLLVSGAARATGAVAANTTLDLGGASLILATGEQGFAKIAASGSAPGAAGAKLAFVCGTNAGTTKLIAYAGTSTTPVTVLDNIGGGVSGC